MSLEKFDNFLCPYCGQDNQLLVDITEGSYHELMVDCEVCCAPIMLRVKLRGQEIITIDARKENE